MEKENVCEKFGHQWKKYRSDILTTDCGSKEILFFRCKVCKFQFNTADDDENDFIEKDYESKETYDRNLVD
jgi:rubredoxin